MQLISILLLWVPFINASYLKTKVKAEHDKFIVCYGKLNPMNIRGYSMVILEPEHYNIEDIEVFKQNNTKVVAYISLTEINKNSKYYESLLPYVFGSNQVWGSCYINIREKQARQIVAGMANDILSKGFNGLFLDNLDNVSEWGKLKGAENELVCMIKHLKKNNSDLFLVQNSGFFLNDKLVNSTDAVLLESLFSLYDFTTNIYGYRDEISLKIMQKHIKETLSKTAKEVYVMEYANTPKMKKVIAKKLQKLGVPYYISNINLQEVTND
ncbi:endo alpha-1,4 polygalactosaminidase [Maribacter litoralis]|uniref:endo alpha-1,4 polygalactosaminidase n=1 Tax=Maribacter litoralis TaxID=2059726 RepID=UPI003F5CD564